MHKSDTPDKIKYDYQFTLPNDKQVSYKIVINPSTLIRENVTPDPAHQYWTRLENHQCRHCPLDKIRHPHCPVAINVSEVIDDWDGIQPHDEIFVECRTKDRWISGTTEAQKALSSFMGLIMATSPCPHFDFFKPMARFHLPLANYDETMFRSIGSFVLAHYFAGDLHETPVINEMEMLYSNLETINLHISQRLRDFENQTTAIGAVVVLDMMSKKMTDFIEEGIHELQKMFIPYLSNLNK